MQMAHKGLSATVPKYTITGRPKTLIVNEHNKVHNRVLNFLRLNTNDKLLRQSEVIFRKKQEVEASRKVR